MPADSPGRLEHVLKVIGTIVTVGGLLFALAQFIVSQATEAQKPYLEKKLAWCEDAVETAAEISVRDRAQVAGKELRFWELYWGVMGLVENKEVTAAMIVFGKGLHGIIPEGKSLKTLSGHRPCLPTRVGSRLVAGLGEIVVPHQSMQPRRSAV